MRLYWLNIRPKHKPKHKQLDWASLDQFTSPSTQWAFSHDYFHIELNFIFSRSKTIIDLELKSKTLENTQNLKSAQIASKSIDLFNWRKKKCSVEAGSSRFRWWLEQSCKFALLFLFIFFSSLSSYALILGF